MINRDGIRACMISLPSSLEIECVCLAWIARIHFRVSCMRRFTRSTWDSFLSGELLSTDPRRGLLAEECSATGPHHGAY